MIGFKSKSGYATLEPFVCYQLHTHVYILFCLGFLLTVMTLLSISSQSSWNLYKDKEVKLEGHKMLSLSQLYLMKNFNYSDNFTFEEGEKNDTSNTNCSILLDSEKFDCYPEEGGNEGKCKARGCCWQPVKTHVRLPPLNVPWCYYPKSYGGYQYVNISYSKNGLRAFLTRTFRSPYPNDVKLLQLDAEYHTSNILHLKIKDPVNQRFESPYPEVPVGHSNSLKVSAYKINIDKTKLLFQVLRTNGDVLFDAFDIGGFIFADQFLQLSAKFKGKIYGLGEHRSSLQLNSNWTKFTMFNHDTIPRENTNLYGSHPFYLVMEPSGNSHGVFFLNSNAMDVLLQPMPAITFRTIGGIFDFYFFLGPTPTDVIRQYTEIIGKPFMPPYWALGFHLSRFGYKDTKHIEEVWNRTRSAEIPFDTQWNDIDYMSSNNDFTYDKKRYAKLPEFVKKIHDVGMHYIPILDPGISACEPQGTYPPYDKGIEMDVFIKSSDGTPFVGKVWNRNCTVFPDFTNPKTFIYWTKLIHEFHDAVPFDGLWIDMNEPSNFLDGTVNGCPNSSLEHPPYLPGVEGGKLNFKTICMTANQFYSSHYNVHNLFGVSEAHATNRALKEVLKKRPFIISRSTYPGIGVYSGHWSGDVISTWHDMKRTISELLSFSLFGVPMMGSDICGFNGNTSLILCQRWSQLGAFYPFSRNHNTDDASDQDPVALGSDVVKSTKKALTVRYTLLPYLYTLFWKAHIFGETVARPLFFEFSKDNKTHDLDESFLWGCCILIVPVLKEYATTVETYLPAAIWYDWYTGLGTGSNGTLTVLSAPSDTIPILIRGGSIIPCQLPNVTTTLSRLNKFVVIAANNISLAASGSLYWDDGESLSTDHNKDFGIVDFQLTPTDLSSYVKFWKAPSIPQLGGIKILGFPKPVNKVLLNKKEVQFNWDPTTLVLKVDDLSVNLNEKFVLSWN